MPNIQKHSSVPNVKPPSGAGSASPAKPPAQSATDSVNQEINNFGKHPLLCDQSGVQPLPGKPEPLIFPMHKAGPQALIEETLDIALTVKSPMAREMALRSLNDEIQHMTPGQLDELKDAIVKRMASDDTSQRERDVLKSMYDVVDAVAENRKPPIYDRFAPPGIHPGKPGFPGIDGGGGVIFEKLPYEIHESKPRNQLHQQMQEVQELSQKIEQEAHKLDQRTQELRQIQQELKRID